MKTAIWTLRRIAKDGLDDRCSALPRRACYFRSGHDGSSREAGVIQMVDPGIPMVSVGHQVRLIWALTCIVLAHLIPPTLLPTPWPPGGQEWQSPR